MRNLTKWAAVLMVAASLSGCAAFGAVIGALPTVVQIVQDAILILDQIDSTARPYFEREENRALLDEYNRRMFTAKKALNVALRASEGGKKLSDEEIDAAFEDFRDAYKDLLALLRENNMMTPDGGFMATPGGTVIDVEQPLALTRVEKD